MAETKHPVCAAHIASRGPRFFRTDDGVMFEITLDARSKIGPRPATERDHHEYPSAWRAFTTDDPAAGEAAKAERQPRKDASRGGGL